MSLEWLAGPGATRVGVWRVRDARDRQVKVLKCAAAHTVAPDPLLDFVRKCASANEYFVLPIERGVSDGVAWSLMPWYGEGTCTLQQALSRGTHWAVVGRHVVQALGRALALLAAHAAAGERWVLHGDIKPSNVLLAPVPGGLPRVLLSDFDGAMLATENPTALRPARYTPRQSAPEMLMAGARVGPAADWWSLGMLVAECVKGRHPFDGISDDGVKDLLVTWPKGPDWGDDTAWRALLGGLLRRDAMIRWGPAMFERWLAGDLSAWADGLLSGNERMSAEPFLVAGTPARTAREVARAMLQHWQVIR